MNNLFLFLSTICFFSDFPKEATGALDYLKAHQEIHKELSQYLSVEEKDIALAIVAPEVGMYSLVEDVIEYKTMCMFYILYGSADFSIGCFQMKPSFVETIEQRIKTNKKLRKKFQKLIIKSDNEKECRKIRMDRLVQPIWQTRYLAAFIKMSKQNTTTINFCSIDEKIKYWATLYNSGLDLSEVQVDKMQQRYLFPRFYGGHNYGEAALDFYRHMKRISH